MLPPEAYSYIRYLCIYVSRYRCIYVSIYVSIYVQWELTNTKIIEKLDALIEEWLNKVDAISVSGTIKSWIVDNVVVSRFSWPFLVYDFPQSAVQNWSN
jgi:hypothetical protein